MTSLIRRGEVIHRIGPATLGVLHDLGWTVRAEAPVTATVSAVVAPVSAAPARAARQAAVGDDLGRTGSSGIAVALPALVVGIGWRVRRR